MCGIAGILNLDGRPVDRRAIEHMTKTLIHRGPDGLGVWLDDAVGFGHTRLSIRDLSERGRQPMIWGDTGPTVTYNGEIYNDRTLRRELEAGFGCEFRTTCDAEIIAPAYRHWGPAAFARFEGMFAIALWDPERGELVLARDAIGIKPLYYSVTARTISFGSEIKALLAGADEIPGLDAEALHIFLGQGYPGPHRSLAAGIKPLPPGSFLIAGKDGVRIERYWAPKRTGEVTDLGDALELFDPLWNKVVEDHLVSDVPVGLLLSGGIDSPLIGAALGGQARPGVVSTFTAGSTIADFDETAEAASVAQRFGLPHAMVTVEPEGTAERFLSIVEHYDGQCADSSGLAFHAVCEAAALRHKVVLTGEGADEFFGGYATYRASRIAAHAGRVLPRRVARYCADCLNGAGSDGMRRVYWTEKLARWLSGIAAAPDCPHPQWRRYGFPRDLGRLYTKVMHDVVGDHDALEEYADAVRQGHGGLVDRCLLADQTYYLPGDLLMKSDAMSMAHGLEVRVPFLDRRIMEFAGRLHASLLTPLWGPDKYVLRQAAARSGVPASITKRGKRGFNVPVARLLRTALKPLGDALLCGEAELLAPHLDADGIRGLWDEHQQGRANHGYILWSLLTLAAWRAGPLIAAHRSLAAA
jgi:asparagine synthase (glutamine-hydrolysing)